MTFKIHLAVALILLTWVSNVNGQEQTFVFRHISVDDGLSQSTVVAIYQDSQGFIWFGTQDGLNKYNGIDFTIFKNRPMDRNSLSHSWIWDICEDRHGNLWVATWDGLNKYDRTRGTFTRYFPKHGDENSISNTRPDCLLLDKRGNLWVGTWGGGLNLYREQTDDFKRYLPDKNDPGSLSNGLVRRLYQDRDGIIWVGTWEGGLNKYNPAHDNFTIYTTQSDPANHVSGDIITSISDGPGYQLWLGTYQNGLSILDKKSDRFVSIEHPVFQFLSDKSITVIIMDDDSLMWIGTQNHGLFIYDHLRHEFQQFKQDASVPNSIKSNFIHSIFQDNSGTVYIGNSGINFFNESTIKFKHYKLATGSNPGLNDLNVWAFAEQDDGNLWIGTENGGLNFMNIRNNVFKSFTHSDHRNSLSSNYVKTLDIDNYGNLWIGNIGGGLDRYRIREKRFENINKIFPDTPFHDELRVNSLVCDNDNIWIGTVGNGIFMYDCLNNTIAHLQKEYNDTVLVSSKYVNELLMDDAGNLWVGGWGGGVSVLTMDDRKLTRYVHDPNNPKSLSNNIVHCLFQDENGTIWVGTNQGLNKLVRRKSEAFNSFDEEFIKYFQKDGLPNEVIYSIEGDLAGNLWISTNYGLSRFDIEHEKFTNFNVQDGLQSNEFNAQSSLRLRNGAMVFGGINGFNLFYPDDIRTDTYQPPVLITRLQTRGININVDSIRAKGNKLVLPYKRNFLSIEFTALEFVAPRKIRYSYIMEGVDQQYIDSEGRRFANYTNLDPGSYVFRLRNTNKDGIWNNKETLLAVTILPPIWLKWWFILIAAVLILSIMYFAYRFRVNRLLEIERLRFRIASDLHDDIGSSLTKISLYSELIKTEKDSKVKSFYLGDISSLSREVVNSLSDIVWSIDVRHDKMQDLLDRIMEFALSVCEPANISVIFEINVAQKNRYLKPICRQNIYLIFKEAINNIIKHAKADKVIVKIDQSGNTFTMKITDNGTGVDLSKTDKGHGLHNMQARAKQFGGEVTYYNNDGFTVSLRCTHIS